MSSAGPSSQTFKAYAAFEAKGQLGPWSYEPKPLGAHDVDVKISHSGICHTDLHQIDNDWMFSSYPLVPGHEIIGTVTAVGSAVSQFKIGQRVGVGAQRNSCGSCSTCADHDEPYCPKMIQTYNSIDPDTGLPTYGGFASGIRVDDRFVVSIPDSIESENAAPLLCAGVTVFSPLRHFAKPADKRVAVIGIGGLGHLALQFAAGMGYEVAAISTSADKEAEARSFGASIFINSKDSANMATYANSFDMILCSAAASFPLDPFLNLLAKDGRFVILAAPAEPLNFSAASLIFKRASICGSLIGSPADLEAMLALAAAKNIKAKTETMPMSAVNAALDKVRRNEPRYRIVLIPDFE